MALIFNQILLSFQASKGVSSNLRIDEQSPGMTKIGKLGE
jgi:hypothetical protein